MEQAFVIDGIKRKVDKVIGRRKLKKDYEYDVQFVGMGPENNIWMDRDSLEQMGFEKMVSGRAGGLGPVCVAVLPVWGARQ